MLAGGNVNVGGTMGGTVGGNVGTMGGTVCGNVGTMGGNVGGGACALPSACRTLVFESDHVCVEFNIRSIYIDYDLLFTESCNFMVYPCASSDVVKTAGSSFKKDCKWCLHCAHGNIMVHDVSKVNVSSNRSFARA